MSKTKSRKERQENASESDSSESHSSASECEPKKEKQSQKSNKNQHHKSRVATKKHKRVSSGSESDSSSTSKSSSSSAASKEKTKIKKPKRESSSEVETKKPHIKSESHDQREVERKYQKNTEGRRQNHSKWDTPEQQEGRKIKRENSRDRDRDREGRRSPERRRSYEQNRNDYAERDRSDNRDRERRNNNYRSRDEDRRGEGNYRRDAREDRNRYNDRRDRSPRRDDRDRGGNDRDNRGRYRSSPQRRDRRNSRDNDNKSYEWGGKTRDDSKSSKASADKTVDKEKPNFETTGALLEDTNKVNGVILKYAEPPEARKPKRRWRLYPFKGETALPTLHIHRQSCFLVGRDRKVVDLAVDHPSCSKQHAALQYRLVPFEREDGTTGKRVRLYLIDLESANGTFLNNKQIEARKYYELIEKDVIKFGFSTREYVLLHENSKEDQEDDDVEIKQEPDVEPERPQP